MDLGTKLAAKHCESDTLSKEIFCTRIHIAFFKGSHSLQVCSGSLRESQQTCGQGCLVMR